MRGRGGTGEGRGEETEGGTCRDTGQCAPDTSDGRAEMRQHRCGWKAEGTTVPDQDKALLLSPTTTSPARLRKGEQSMRLDGDGAADGDHCGSRGCRGELRDRSHCPRDTGDSPSLTTASQSAVMAAVSLFSSLPLPSQSSLPSLIPPTLGLTGLPSSHPRYNASRDNGQSKRREGWSSDERDVLYGTPVPYSRPPHARGR